MDLFQAGILGIVEGLTEFLPISSTAHLMLASRLLGIEQTDFAKAFQVAIQPGAILAVVVLYWRQLLVDRATMLRVAVAFVPTAIAGLLFFQVIKNVLLESHVVAILALAIGGVVLILFERWRRPRVREFEELRTVPLWRCAAVGLCQAVACIPGVSRAAATIVGAMLLGCSRRTAVEFSFLLAVPTLTAAAALSAWDVYSTATLEQHADAAPPAATPIDGPKHERALEVPIDMPRAVLLWAVGSVVSFVVAIGAIVFLLEFVRSHSLAAFGMYRIGLAAVMAAVLWSAFG